MHLELLSCYIFVIDGLAITDDLIDDENVIIGNTIRMKCKVSTVENKEVIFRWYRGYKTKRLSKGGRVNIINDPQKHLSILEINNSMLTDAGMYTCEVIGSKQKSDTRFQYILVVGE